MFVVLFLFVVPTVPYTLSLQIPFVFRPGLATCEKLPEASQLACEDSYLYPPENVTERAPLSYALFGIGTHPFNSSYRITADDSSAIFYVTGTKVLSVQSFPFPSFDLNPQGVVAIRNTSVTLGGLGLVNFSATITNIGAQPLSPVYASFEVPGDLGNNQTRGGVVWDNYFVGSRCALVLAPGSSCSFSYQPFSDSLSGGQPFSYRVGVTTSTNASRFSTDPMVYQRFFQGVWPGTGISSGWVNALIQEVDSNRTGPNLVEDQSLDAFAATRFETQVANYNVSNYGFQGDFAKSFPGSTQQIGEVTLWPGSDLPSEYAGFLQQSAPGHWSVLTDSMYTHFGYYVGYGPTIVADQPCSVTEFPANVNMTALLTSHGCQFQIEQAVWLVIEVGT